MEHEFESANLGISEFRNEIYITINKNKSET